MSVLLVVSDYELGFYLIYSRTLENNVNVEYCK